MAVLKPGSHDHVGYITSGPFMGVEAVNHSGATLLAANPAIFHSINSTGQVVVAQVTASGTVSGSTSVFDQLPDYKVLGFTTATVNTSTKGQCYICGILSVNVMATVGTGKPLIFGDGGGATAGMIQGTYTNKGKIRAFAADAVGAGGGTITALVLPWNI